MSDYISKSAFIEDIKTEIVNLAMNGLKGTPRSREELYQLIERIEEQPTVDEKEIIRKPMERIKERLEEEFELSEAEKERCIKENPLQFDSAKGYSVGISNAIDFVKEEGGIE